MQVMHTKIQNNPLKTSDTELQCIFPVLQYHPEKVLWYVVYLHRYRCYI